MTCSYMDVSAEFINDRQRVPNELLQVSFLEGNLHLRGWAFVRDYQNYYGADTHQFRLHLRGPVDKTYELSLESINLSRFMSYRGNRWCSDHERSKRICNHRYENIGFNGVVPIGMLPEGEYATYLEIYHPQTNRTVEIPLYLASMQSVEHRYLGKHITIDSLFQQGGLTVYYHTLIATSTPSPSYEGEVVEHGNSCSSAHGNTVFYREGAIFNKILDVKRYQGIVSYFKTKAKVSGCVDGRQRLVEGDEITVHIPSTFVNYTGGSMKIRIHSLLPTLTANPLTINQYQKYNEYEKVSAKDSDNKDISNRIRVISNTVNVRIPGVYQTCYRVQDQWNQVDERCRRVYVHKIPTYYRYISAQSYESAQLNLWRQMDLNDILMEELKKRKNQK